MKTRIILIILCALLILTLTACGYRRANRSGSQSPAAAPTQPAKKAVAPTQIVDQQPTPDSLKELSNDADALDGLLDGIDKDLNEMDTLPDLK
jgi:hypothetical protein